MSSESAEVVLQGFELLREERLDELVSQYSPDATISSHTHRAELAGETFRGRDAIRAYFEDFFESYRDVSFDVERVEELAGGEVVVIYRLSAVGRGSGVPVNRHNGIRNRVHAGLIEQEIVYASPADALSAAGLATET